MECVREVITEQEELYVGCRGRPWGATGVLELMDRLQEVGRCQAVTVCNGLSGKGAMPEAMPACSPTEPQCTLLAPVPKGSVESSSLLLACMADLGSSELRASEIVSSVAAVSG